ncbi:MULTISPECIES: PLP-dependent aminotransferase family protein [unclassified Sphingobacterium]|uniref:aminotransferase-like domain-containing protein n=1 Tax=unclassified Sphingobacterium TaxID=2609468 RepID=UPI002954F553|nr:PLP-dependent aminotransferase family protein [Sphingobacterium sp. UGAL515B_05]WON93338.1 PLP-dependent aminotransferase family protein [Sphingobacterium sp. UGAL515B_05]
MKSYKFEIFTQIIEKNIKSGIYKPGQKLPSVRELKDYYGFSMTTIQAGYDYLMIKGVVESVPKSGYYVGVKNEKVIESSQVIRPPVVRDAVFEQGIGLTTSSRLNRHFSEFNVAAPGDLFVPQKLLLRTMQQVIREKGAGLLRYYPTNGSTLLRDNIVSRAASQRTLLNTEELLITDGALQALYIALTAVCKCGDVIAVESPCVFSVLEVIRVLKLRVIEIPVGTNEGFDIDIFRQACKGNAVKAVVLTPNFHNPTGILLSNEQKITLLAIAYQYNVAVIENDIYGDLNFQGSRPSTIKEYDESGLVMTFSSYSKTLAPGIRLGWLSTGKFLKDAERIKFALGSTVSPLNQETVNRLIGSSSYDRHIRSLKMQLAKNAYMAINLIASSFPEKTEVVTPQGGYNLWVKIPEGINMHDFYIQCERIGARFTPGYTFSFSNNFGRYFRLVIADKFTEKRIEAIQQVGRYVCEAP